jgi:hypothetical protein
MTKYISSRITTTATRGGSSAIAVRSLHPADADEFGEPQANPVRTSNELGVDAALG